MLRSLRACTEGLAESVSYQGVKGGFDEFCKGLRTRNDRKIVSFQWVAEVTEAKRRVIEKRFKSKG
jgi:hypothetical protein